MRKREIEEKSERINVSVHLDKFSNTNFLHWLMTAHRDLEKWGSVLNDDTEVKERLFPRI